MERGPTQEQTFESILRERGVSDKDIGWVLSKLDSQEYILDYCHYIACILSKESETHAKDIFINRFFSLTIKDITSEHKINDLLQECIDKKKIWTLLEKNLGATCIKLPDASINGQRYLFLFGPNKKCPELTNIDSFVFFSPNDLQGPKKQNPLEMCSLRLA
ncbi:hypothetical protein [Prochlorococcus marinus]|uniref:Uncharacterized protein n=1 Tax=Prochlorococcus marinus XMU1408 TaxID=2213228 RepID=A0A318R3Q6_PROMR|nr:hypothetical protein [Prochlorococcus marinus]MBW3041079.1 hypothetical protein [Prochlorococcus marinus str. XMU1408]PYE03684.1 hypothetical protein DNJ73_00400 [Prochlorococcus marinus XMU1408]